MATAETIEINNIGPIEHVSIPVPQGGGVMVLRGRNGRGKSHAIEAAESLASGKNKLEVRDGALSGSVAGLGVTLKVGRRMTRTGELTVETLDGRLSVAELVDPKLKSPDAADAKRIKALVELVGAKADPALFYDLVGGREQLEAGCSVATLETDNIVQMADRIKRDLEKHARMSEERASHEEGHAKGCLQAVGEVDLTVQSDAVILQRALESAIESQASIRQRAAARAKALEAKEQAAERLRQADEQRGGESLESLVAREEQRRQEVTQCEQRIEELAAKLADAQNDLRVLNASLEATEQARRDAQQHQATIAAWRDQLAIDVLPAIPQEEIDAAEDAVRAAREAVERGAVVRQAMRHHAEANKHVEAASVHRQRAKRLRDAARGTDEVLSALVARSGCDELRVEGGRLVTTTARGATYFGDLSEGERWRIALEIAAKALPPGGLLAVPQEAWESLDPINRGIVNEAAKKLGIVVLTAEASDDESVTTELYQS